MTGVTLQDRNRTDDIRKSLGIDSIGSLITRARLRWFDHMHRKTEDDWVKRITRLEVDGRRPPGRPQITWYQLVTVDLRRLQLRTSAHL